MKAMEAAKRMAEDRTAKRGAVMAGSPFLNDVHAFHGRDHETRRVK
jgi:hypothetical protein